MMRKLLTVVFLMLLAVGIFGRNLPAFADDVADETPTIETNPVPNETDERAASAAAYRLDLTEGEFFSEHVANYTAGKKLMDIEIRWTGSEERYSAIWYPIPDDVYVLIQGTPTQWSTFLNDMRPKNGRYLDFEVGYFGGEKRYSAIFMEDGDDYNYAVHTTNSDESFQSYSAKYLDAGMSLIDFEAYTEPDGDVRFAGLWVSDPNQPQTVLYYGLESADVSDLISPRFGRVIDLEYYYSELHGENRTAMLFAMDAGGEQYQRRHESASALSFYHASFSDGNTHIIDIDTYEINGNVYYHALWGDTYKSLHEVDRIVPDSELETLPNDASTLITNYEFDYGNIGLYAKNVRSDQSLAYRPDEPFYLASTAKIPIHIKLWREFQNGHLSPTQQLYYTNGSNKREPWFVDERSDPGFDRYDFGKAFTLLEFDAAMMMVSDNAATTALVDSPHVGLMQDGYDLNEWLADISGVGQGWGPVTSIHDVDRAILWQGQQNTDDAPECSYFTIPGWAFEPLWSTGEDNFGDLDDWLDVNASNCERGDIADGDPGWGDALPESLRSAGHARYYNMGLNTATPKATTLLLEKFVQGELLDATTTDSAVTAMDDSTPLDNAAGWPAHIDVYGKGGLKGGESYPVSNAGIIDLGPDQIVLSLLSKNNTLPFDNIRSNYFAPLSLDALQTLSADLQSCYFATFDGSDTVYAGQTVRYFCYMRNDGGGNASTYEVDFYASTNTTITESDYLLGTVAVSNHFGATNRLVTLDVTLPDDIPTGDYYVGWFIDPRSRCFSADAADCKNYAGNISFGNVGEFNESNNNGYDSDEMLTVTTLPTAVGIASQTAGAGIPLVVAVVTPLIVGLVFGTVAIVRRRA